MEQGQINDTLNQIFTDKELGQIVSALKNSYFEMKNSENHDNTLHIETALQKIGWVIDENEPGQIRMLRDYEL
jgi:hypothetical protein